MTAREYQKYVRESMSSAYDNKLAAVALVEEVGECLGVIKKQSIYSDMSKFVTKYGMPVEEKIKDEMGDILYQYFVLAAQYGLDIQDIMEYNVNKLNERHGGAGRTAADGGGRR